MGTENRMSLADVFVGIHDPRQAAKVEHELVELLVVAVCGVLAEGCVESTASTVEQVIAETAVSRLTERGATRADDRISEAGMEDRKRQGYF